MPSTTITAAGASDSLAITSGNDGTLVIQSGPTGAKVNALTISSAGVVKPLDAAWPAFSAYISATQTVTSNTATKANVDTKVFDTSSAYDTTNKRWTPQVAGYYQINGCLQLLGASVVGYCYIAKNGNSVALGSGNAGAGANPVVTVSYLVYLNGTTDYVELWGYTSGTQFQQNAPTSYFTGALVRAA